MFVKNPRSPLWNEEEAGSDKELLAMLIDAFTNLQRIQSAPDQDKEIEYQIKILKTKLKAFGVPTEELEIQ